MNPRFRRALQNAALVVGSVVLAVVLLEVAFRVQAYVGDRSGRLDELRAETAGRAKSGEKRRIRLSSNDRIVYELEPNHRVVDDRGRVYTTNAMGFRGYEVSFAKPPGTVRIVGLGDSVMYGNGVSDGEVFLALLSRALNDRYPDEHWEVVNTAVPGYNTVMEVETLATKGLEFQPDLVVIMFVGNDLNLPNFIRDSVDPLAFDSFLWKAVMNRLGRISPSRLVRAPQSDKGFWYEGDPEKVPARYSDMVGLEAYRRAMGRLKALSEERGFEVLVVQQYDRGLTHETSDELGMAYFCFNGAIEEFMNEHGIEDWRGSILSVGASDPHPSTVGHALYARALLDHLEEGGGLERARRHAGLPALARPEPEAAPQR